MFPSLFEIKLGYEGERKKQAESLRVKKEDLDDTKTYRLVSNGYLVGKFIEKDDEILIFENGVYEIYFLYDETREGYGVYEI